MLDAFLLDGELAFLFIKEFIFKKDLESSLIFVLFLKGKQNKNIKNPECDSLFGKYGL